MHNFCFHINILCCHKHQSRQNFCEITIATSKVPIEILKSWHVCVPVIMHIKFQYLSVLMLFLSPSLQRQKNQLILRSFIIRQNTSKM